MGMLPLINPINSPYITWVILGSQSSFKGLQLWGLAVFPPFAFYETTFENDFWIQKTEDVGFNGGYTRSRTLFGSSQAFWWVVEGFWLQLHPPVLGGGEFEYAFMFTRKIGEMI